MRGEVRANRASLDPPCQGFNVDRLGGIHFDNGIQAERFRVFGKLADGDFLFGVSRMFALLFGALGETAFCFLESDPAMDFDDLAAEAGDLVALVSAPGPEIGFDDDLWALAGQSPEDFHGGMTEAVGVFLVVGRTSQGHEERLLDIVFAQKRETERFGQRP